MDDRYLDAFVRESEEAITELNNSLLDLEADPGNRAAMDSIFRTAHTLKGNFGAMGLEDASDLAHAVEDLLDAMRRGEMAVTADRMDLVFAGVDTIEVIVREIDREGESTTDTAEMVEQLRAVLAEADGGVVDEGATVDDAADAEAVGETLGDAPEVETAEVTDLSASVGDDGSGVSGAGAAADVGSVGASAAGGVDVDELHPDDEVAASEDGSVDEIKSVRVDVDRLDDLHGLVEQLVTSRIKLRRAVETDDLDGAAENLNELDKITASLQNTVMDVRFVPLKKVVGKFPRMVRDLARDLDKDVEFAIEGEEIELDRTILTEISDPLMHIIRNAIDHGIESPTEREAAGKSPTGQIELRASRERDHVVIEVEDDGAGLDVEEIRCKAIEQGVRSPEELETMDRSSVYDLVFHPGFSTADEVTDTSGRGVGMDVVHDTVTQLEGSVNVESLPGEGTTISLRLPVTMAIVTVLFVEVGEEEYGIPLKNVDEITRTTEVNHVNGNEVIKHDDEIYPVVHLGERFAVPGARNGRDDGIAGDGHTDDGMLVRIRESERRVALYCDEVVGQEEVLVKPLEGVLSGTPGLSGTAVLGDGNIVHILDVVTL